MMTDRLILSFSMYEFYKISILAHICFQCRNLNHIMRYFWSFYGMKSRFSVMAVM